MSGLKTVPKITPIAREKTEGVREVKITLPSLSFLQKEIHTQIQTSVVNLLEEILQKIAKDKNLDYNALKTEYLLPLNDIVYTNKEIDTPTQQEQSKKTEKKIVPATSRCMARTGNKTQCTRNRGDNSDYCGSHTPAQPYGRIDENITEDKGGKRRGRPLKKIITVEDVPVTPEDLHGETVKVAFTVIEHKGKSYLISSDGKIYDEPKNNTCELTQVGMRTEEGVLVFL